MPPAAAATNVADIIAPLIAADKCISRWIGPSAKA
jgi:hypothetical protein